MSKFTANQCVSSYLLYNISDLSIDAMDVSGEQQIDVDHHLWKQRIDLEGNKIDEAPEKEGTEQSG